MMMDIATFGVGLANAPSITGFGGIGSGIPDNIPDDDIEGMIDGFGFFQEQDELFDIKSDEKDLFAPQSKIETTTTTSSTSSSSSSTAKISSTNLPILTNDTGAVVAIPEVTISTPRESRIVDTGAVVAVPEVTPRDVRSLHFATSNLANNKEISIALPQPPQLLSSHQTPLPCSSDSKSSLQSMLDQQRETILRNQKIIEAQKNELHGKIHPPVALSSNANGTKTPATYALARAALKKADEQAINGKKITKGVKRKTSSLAEESAENNAYKKWKMTPAGATKLKAVDSTGMRICRSPSKQEDPSIKTILTPGELEIRRERNRKHAKKSRLRKKSLTSELEQSLEALREENTNLRKLVEEYIAKKKDASSSATSVEWLLEKRRVQSHERFIKSIVTNSGKPKSKKSSKDSSSKRMTETNSTAEKSIPYSGKGIIVDEKTLKVLKGLSKSFPSSIGKPQKR